MVYLKVNMLAGNFKETSLVNLQKNSINIFFAISYLCFPKILVYTVGVWEYKQRLHGNINSLQIIQNYGSVYQEYGKILNKPTSPAKNRVTAICLQSNATAHASFHIKADAVFNVAPDSKLQTDKYVTKTNSQCTLHHRNERCLLYV